MEALKKYIKHHKSIDALLSREKVGSHLSIIQESLIYYGVLLKNKTPIFVVKENQNQVENLKNTLKSIDESLDIISYTYDESLRIEAISPSELLKYERIETLNKLIMFDYDICIVDSLSTLRKISSKDVLKSQNLTIKLGDEFNIIDLQLRLEKMGYTRVKYVEKPFTYAIRGGICDIFGIGMQNPLRVEFFDIEVDSLRYFDIETQRSIETIDKINISFANEIILSDKEIDEIVSKTQLTDEISLQFDLLRNTGYETSMYPLMAHWTNYNTILDYIEDAHVFISHIEGVEREVQNKLLDVNDFMEEADTLYAPLDKLFNLNAYYFYEYQHELEINLPWHQSNLVTNDIDELMQIIRKEAIDQRVILVLEDKYLKETKKELDKRNMSYSLFSNQKDPGIYVYESNLSVGFILDDIKTIIYTRKEIYNYQGKYFRYDNIFNKAESLYELAELDTFDYVVHRQYGIGKYMGITTKEVEGIKKDFMRIQYRDGDELFVPLEKFHLVRKYISSEAVSVKLSKLGSSAWQKSQKRIRDNIQEVADKLIALYSKRSKSKGHAFSKDTDYQLQFEQEFPYDLTPDQEVAISEIKSDMESDMPMDRLLCGDVGFGKTEVAIRAAFKAVVDEKQVIFLCPTTILSSQHYNTFKDRFKNYPIKIEVLNRFVTPKKQKEIIHDFREGLIDILIGTHRVLSKDVVPNDLGLLIIDEEQRFGVEHKEKIKEIKVNVDVLSLSATPIPRTLQMSLVGIRSLSQLNTPPQDRLPVMTYVIEKDEKTIFDVIQKELNRNGQVFYLYNNVERIYSVATNIQMNIDRSKVGVIHGQMPRTEIEDVMYRFINKEINTLVCTTIIETGIDIPNANTILVDNAHHFGLSQLYQIKGRVGRSDRLAYAYFIVPSKENLSEVAQKRLQAIKEFTQLGSGYKIAMRDLTIRGAGELLGGNQSGFIDTVGIELYVELLKEAIDMRQGTYEKPKEKVSVNIEGYLPDGFAVDDREKLDLYQEINGIKDTSELHHFYQNIEDRFGTLPNEVMMLLEKKRLEIFLNDKRIERFKEYRDRVELSFTEEYSNIIDGMHLFEIVSDRSYDIQIKYLNKKISLTIPTQEEWVNDLLYILENIKEQKA